MLLGAIWTAGGAFGWQAADPAAELERTQAAFQIVIEGVAPRVVSLRVHRRSPLALGEGLPALEQLVVVNGSGTVVREDGSILTNEHVVQSAELIEVIFADGATERGTVVAADARSDLAIVRTARHGAAISFCDWGRVARGQWTIILGNPYGLGVDGNTSVSIGVIANLGRRLPGLGEVDDRLYGDMIQTTAAINPGNSGGPLLSIRGELVGVVTAMHTRSATDDGIGFAIAMTPAKRRIIDRLLEGRAIEYGYLGLEVRLPEPDERRATELAERVGVVVVRAEPDGPSARAGVRPGDVIFAIDNEPVGGPAQFAEIAGALPVGRSGVLSLVRGDERLQLAVVADRREISRVAWMRGEAVLWRGLRVADLTGALRQRLRLEAGIEGVVVVDVARQSPGDRSQLRIGDVIESVGEQPTRDVSAFRRQVEGQPGAVALRIWNRGEFLVQP